MGAAPLEAAPQERFDLAADGEPLPRIRDRSLQAILLAALVLLLVSWHRLAGYQLADSVEYMERALSLARGEPQDTANAVRSFGFSVLLAPIFFAEERLGIEREVAVVGAVRVLQIALGLALIAACARLGARLGGRRAGLASGWLVAVNPIFMQYAVSPVSGVAAALFVALGLERLIGRAPPRRALAGGLALGGAFMLAYQTLLVSLPLVALVALRDRRARWRTPCAAGAGLALGIGAQVVLDRLTWGAWGVSVGNYVVENANGVIVTSLVRLGLRDTALWVYERAARLADFTIQSTTEPLRQKQPRDYYFSEIDLMLVRPVLVMGLAGIARALRRPSWKLWIPLLVLTANVAAMSLKGAKSFRLWIPLLPMIAPLCAFGLAWLWAERDARFARWRTALAALALAAAAVLGVERLHETNTRRFGAYWIAADYVNRMAEREDARGVRVASAYHWAVFHRQSPRVELVKLPHHVHAWAGLDAAQRAECIAALDGVDWFVAHRPALEQDRALYDALAARFELYDFAWEPEGDPDLGPILVLRRRTGAPDARLLCDESPPEDARAYRLRYGLERAMPEPLDFLGRTDEADEGAPYDRRLTLLGVEYDALPESGCGWITYHWTSPSGLARPAVVLDRLTPPDGAHCWQNDHEPGSGFRPTDAWQPGAILREGHPVLPGADAFTERFVPLGGAYRRGDLLPVELWIGIAHRDGDGVYAGGLAAARWGAPRPLDWSAATELAGSRRRSPEGFVASMDGLVRAARLLIAVPPRERWPDDGRGDPP